MPRFKKRSGFSLVELMIAVSILSIGIVAVLTSFLNSASLLDSLRNRIMSVNFLEAKISDLRQKAIEEEGVESDSYQEEVMLGNRAATFKMVIQPLDVEELKDCINKVNLSLSWQEGNRNKDESLVTYLPLLVKK
jgi:prepilin-type N-terminal cleavage/methylation domain-containing protein